MERLYGPRIDAHIARIQIGQIMDPAAKNN
jgi:hypothetical protein